MDTPNEDATGAVRPKLESRNPFHIKAEEDRKKAEHDASPKATGPTISNSLVFVRSLGGHQQSERTRDAEITPNNAPHTARKLPPAGVPDLYKLIIGHLLECGIALGLVYAAHLIRPEVWQVGWKLVAAFYGFAITVSIVHCLVWRIPTQQPTQEYAGTGAFIWTLIPYIKAAAVLLLLAYSGAGYREQIWTLGHWAPIAVLLFGVGLALARSAGVRASAAWIQHRPCPICGATAIGNRGFCGPNAKVDVECISCGRLIRFSTSGTYLGYLPRRRWKALGYEQYHKANLNMPGWRNLSDDHDDPDEFPEHRKGNISDVSRIT